MLDLPSDCIHFRVPELISLRDVQLRVQRSVLIQVGLRSQEIHVAFQNLVQFGTALRQIV